MKLTLIVLEIVVQYGTLLPYQFSYELLTLSHKHRLYLLPRHYTLGATHFHTLVRTSLKRNSRWTLLYSSLSCWFSIFRHLGFNLMPYNIFFLLSPHSRLGLFHPYVVVMLPLGLSSNSSSIGCQKHHYIHISVYPDYFVTLANSWLKSQVCAHDLIILLFCFIIWICWSSSLIFSILRVAWISISSHSWRKYLIVSLIFFR